MTIASGNRLATAFAFATASLSATSGGEAPIIVVLRTTSLIGGATASNVSPAWASNNRRAELVEASTSFTISAAELGLRCSFLQEIDHCRGGLFDRASRYIDDRPVMSGAKLAHM